MLPGQIDWFLIRKKPFEFYPFLFSKSNAIFKDRSLCLLLSILTFKGVLTKILTLLGFFFPLF